MNADIRGATAEQTDDGGTEWAQVKQELHNLVARTDVVLPFADFRFIYAEAIPIDRPTENLHRKSLSLLESFPRPSRRCAKPGSFNFRPPTPEVSMIATKGKVTRPARTPANPTIRPTRGPTSPAPRVSAKTIDDGQPEQNALRGQGLDLAVACLKPSPYNKRRSFPEAEIESLAESIEAHGLLQPILVRMLKDETGTFDLDQYEIVAGERRFHAAKKAGLKMVPCIVRELDDRQARELCVLENLQRKDLSAIEEAEGFKAILETGQPGDRPPTQVELAKRLGVTQGHIANRLRLLKLPAGIQAKVISGEILASHARDFLVLEACPRLMTAAAKCLDATDRNDEPCVQDEVRDAICYVVRESTRPMTGSYYDEASRAAKQAPKFTAADRAVLEILELPTYAHGFDKPEPRATNVDIWDNIWRAANAKKTQRDDAKAEKQSEKKPRIGTDRHGTTAGGLAKSAAPTPAELKRQAEEEQQRRREQTERTQRRVEEFRADWTRYVIYTKLASLNTTSAVLAKLAWYFAALPARNASDALDRTHLLGAVGVKPANRKGLLASDLPRMTPWLAAMFFRPLGGKISIGGPAEAQETVPAEDLPAIADLLGVDFEAAWKKEQCGPLTDEYWELHTKEQLAEVGEEVGVYIEPDKPKSVALKLLSSPGRALPLPRELGGKKRKK